MAAPDTHQQAIERYENTVHALEDLIEVGISLSSNTDIVALTEHIFLEAKKYAHADGATLYIRTTDNMLEFVSMRTDSLGIASGGTTGTNIILPPVALYLADGSPNNRQVASYSALQGEIVNIANLYENDQFDFEATKKFDAETGYRTLSFLTIPLKNTSQHVIGVLQLLNALDPDTGEVTAFPEEPIPYIRSLASQVAVATEKQKLFDNQRKLLDSFIRLIGTAIDAKSKYTGGHCQRVPELVKMLTRAACDQSEGVFSDFELDDEGWYELHLGAWLHDCGKVTTPEYVVDKATKLETITDRIHEVRTRFEVVKRDETIKYLEAVIAGKDDPEKLKQQLQDRHKELDSEFAFLAECNIGTDNMPDGERGADPRTRRGRFNPLHLSKYGITADIAHPRGKALLGELVSISDVVIENFRTGAMERRGLGYERVKQIKPDIIMLSMPAFGNTGPWKDFIQYGIGKEQLGGISSMNGYQDSDGPVKSGVTFGDPISGAHAAGAVLSALLYRRRTGKGMFIDVSQLESSIATIGEHILAYQMNQRPPQNVGNRHPVHAPHGASRCKGDDKWVAIAVTSDAEWPSRC